MVRWFGFCEQDETDESGKKLPNHFITYYLQKKPQDRPKWNYYVRSTFDNQSQEQKVIWIYLEQNLRVYYEREMCDVGSDVTLRLEGKDVVPYSREDYSPWKPSWKSFSRLCFKKCREDHFWIMIKDARHLRGTSAFPCHAFKPCKEKQTWEGWFKTRLQCLFWSL